MATVKFNLEADEAKAVQAFLRVVDAQQKAERQFKRTTGAGKAQETNLSKMSNTITSMAAGYLSVAAAVNGVTRALRFQNEELDKASGRTRSSEFALGQLSQLAGGDPKVLRRLVDESKATSREAGIDLSQAARLQFNLESLGISDQRKLFADLVGTVEDPAALAEATVTLQTAFGKGEAGGIRNILNKGLAASAVSKTTLNQLLTNASTIAPGLREIGATDEEGLAALAILSKARKSPEQASTEIQALSKTLLEKGLGGKGLFEGIAALENQTKSLNQADKIKFFGRVEGFKGFSTLSQNAGEVVSAFDSIKGADVAEPGDQVAGAIAARRAIPEIESIAQVRRSEQATAQTRSDLLAVGENKQLSLLQRIEEASLKQGESPFTRFLRMSAAEVTKFFGGDDQDIISSAAAGGSFGSTSGALEFVDAVKELTATIKQANAGAVPVAGTRNGGMVE